MAGHPIPVVLVQLECPSGVMRLLGAIVCAHEVPPRQFQLVIGGGVAVERQFPVEHGICHAASSRYVDVIEKGYPDIGLVGRRVLGMLHGDPFQAAVMIPLMEIRFVHGCGYGVFMRIDGDIIVHLRRGRQKVDPAHGGIDNPGVSRRERELGRVGIIPGNGYIIGGGGKIVTSLVHQGDIVVQALFGNINCGLIDKTGFEQVEIPGTPLQCI